MRLKLCEHIHVKTNIDIVNMKNINQILCQ